MRYTIGNKRKTTQGKPMKFWSLKGKNVLIVDDFQEMRSMLRSMIEPLAPSRIYQAKDGDEAIEQLETHDIDIIFCDYNLGKGKDGQQILEEAKHRSLLSHAAIFILVTAENTSRMVMGAIDYLPDDYISKPFTRTLIQERLKKLLQKKETLLEISRAIAEKDYLSALNLCEKRLTANPESKTDLIKTKGEILIKLGRYENAADLYENLLEQRDIPWAYLALGQVRYFQGKYYDAEALFERLINENPANVAAHDWLARTLEALGEYTKAQKIVQTAIEKSPKSLLRQRKLAELAWKNADLETAEIASKNALEVGQYSCYKQPDDYTEYAKILLKTTSADKALAIIEKMKMDYVNKNTDAQFHAAVCEGLIYKEMGDITKCEQAIEKSLAVCKANPESLTSTAAIQLTDLCLQTGKNEDADTLLKYLVRNHHEDKVLLEKTQQMYAQAGRSDQGDKLISQTRDEVVKINNEGAVLLKQGKLEESIELFMKAARGMPDNAVININAAFSMIKLMQKTGKTKKYLPRAIKYLERVHKLDPGNKKYYQLMEMVQKFSDKAA